MICSCKSDEKSHNIKTEIEESTIEYFLSVVFQGYRTSGSSCGVWKFFFLNVWLTWLEVTFLFVYFPHCVCLIYWLLTICLKYLTFPSMEPLPSI